MLHQQASDGGGRGGIASFFATPSAAEVAKRRRKTLARKLPFQIYHCENCCRWFYKLNPTTPSASSMKRSTCMRCERMRNYFLGQKKEGWSSSSNAEGPKPGLGILRGVEDINLTAKQCQQTIEITKEDIAEYRSFASMGYCTLMMLELDRSASLDNTILIKFKRGKRNDMAVKWLDGDRRGFWGDLLRLHVVPDAETMPLAYERYLQGLDFLKRKLGAADYERILQREHEPLKCEPIVAPKKW